MLPFIAGGYASRSSEIVSTKDVDVCNLEMSAMHYYNGISSLLTTHGKKKSRQFSRHRVLRLKWLVI